MNKYKKNLLKTFYKNQTGEITIFQIIVLVMASSILLLTTLTSRIERAQLQDQNDKILCSRAYTTSLKKLKSYFIQTNSLIASAKLAKVATIFIPGAGTVSVANGQAIKALKIAQEIAMNTFVSEQILKSKSCPIIDVIGLNPVRTELGKIKRDKMEKAILKPKIEFEYIGKNFSTQIKIQVERFPKEGSVWIYLRDKKGVWSLTSSLPFS
jgi:hypothetical protein